jgi:hypothetical protein
MSRRLAIFGTIAWFCASLAAYASSPIAASIDSRWSLHTAMSFANGNGGDLTDDRPALEKFKFYAIIYPDGRPRTYFPIGASLLALPGVVIASWIEPNLKEWLRQGAVDQLEKLLASIIGAAAVAVFFWLLYGQFQSVWIAGGSTYIFAFCTSMWSTATRALWQHGPLLLMLVIAMLLLQRARHRPALVQFVSLPLAFAFLCRPTAMVPIVVLSTYVLLFYRPWFVRYLCWAVPIAIPWLADNVTIYGNLFPTYYVTGWAPGSMWESFLGNLVSPSRGLLIFSPVLILSLSGFALAMRDRAQRPLYLAYGVSVVLMMLAIVGHPKWWAGHSFGPRFTSDLLAFLAYFTAFNFAYFMTLRLRMRAALIGVAVVLAEVSALIHAQGALYNAPLIWNALPEDVETHPARVWDWRDPQFLRNWNK